MPSNIRIGKEWKTLLEFPCEKCDYTMVAIGNDRIAFVGGYAFVGGLVSRKPLDMVDIYNLKSKDWSSFKMEKRRYSCAAVAIDEKLFVFGGRRTQGYDGFLSSCEMYDLSEPSHKSHFLPPLSEACSGLGAVVYDNTNVVVLGGYKRPRYLSNVSMFDTINKKWIELPSMPTERGYFAVGVSGSSIIAAGGFGAPNAVDVLEMQTLTWKRVANMNESRYHHGGSVIGSSTNSFRMVVVGGHMQNSCEIYSFKDDSWSSLPDLQSNSYSRQLIVMDGMLIAGGDERLETLDLSTPNLIYELVHFLLGLDVFSSLSKNQSCKRKPCATVAKRD